MRERRELSLPPFAVLRETSAVADVLVADLVGAAAEIALALAVGAGIAAGVAIARRVAQRIAIRRGRARARTAAHAAVFVATKIRILFFRASARIAITIGHCVLH